MKRDVYITVSNYMIQPSTVQRIPEDVTHIVWYTR